jgi:hypothetical protein
MRSLARLAFLSSLAIATAGLAAEVPEQPARPRLDVAFVLDTTGSMGDEIDVVKEQLVGIARRLASGQPAPDVRFAVVAFRDKGDDYVTRTLTFERDVKKVQKFILALDANGGGDEPEDVSAGLHAALKLPWDLAPEVARVAFLVGDAGPHAYPGEPTVEHAVANLREKKIAVHAIGCSGLGGAAKAAFTSIAERTSGEFEVLTYRRVERYADGRARTVLTAGGDTFVAERELSDDEWKKGAPALLAEGKVKKDASAGPALGGVAAEGGFGARGSGMGGGGIGRPSAAAPATMTLPTNNLDEEISSKLLRAAERAGTRYVK